ncbi:MAG: hypothetical protein FWH53_01445 [Leptospirales bacterium]|nr:hypothetical protein [Leptospirales bacterium]
MNKVIRDFEIKKYRNEIMTYPPKADPSSDTWVIAFDVKLDKLYEYARDPQNAKILGGKTPDIYVRDLRAIIFNEIYRVLGNYGFDKRLQNSLVFNNKLDATIAFKAVSLGLAESWSKYFVDRIHLFRVDPNSDAIELLNKEKAIEMRDKPDWLTDEMFFYITNIAEELEGDGDYNN